MGMSASQARFLSLTARKTNVEYEGMGTTVVACTVCDNTLYIASAGRCAPKAQASANRRMGFKFVQESRKVYENQQRLRAGRLHPRQRRAPPDPHCAEHYL